MTAVQAINDYPPRVAGVHDVDRHDCIYHGGAFFAAIGEEFDTLERASDVISADVLDAWFPPSPRVLRAIEEHLPFLVRTSPPTSCEGLVRTIARVRDVDERSILPGGGSSDLIFLALTRWLTRASRVLILDPMYGEYAHVLERVIGCHVDRLTLTPDDGYGLDVDRLLAAGARAYDLVIVVNPNSPTGRHASRRELLPVVRALSRTTRVWVDETYIEYAGHGESLESYASTHDNVIVCKSMSKVYALSGARVGYLCASPSIIDELRPFSPPWAVGLIGQVAAVNALMDTSGYYESRWTETHGLREDLAGALRALGIQSLPGVANFLMCELPAHGPVVSTLVSRARSRDLYLRDISSMGSTLGNRAFRIAVKDAATNRRMVRILGEILELHK